MSKNKELINSRTVLWYLVFVGFAVNYMIRINMNIAIVAMIKQNKQENSAKFVKSYDCHVEDIQSIAVMRDHQNFSSFDKPSDSFHQNVSSVKQLSLEQRCLQAFEYDTYEDGFSWNEYEQGLILGSFFWLHWVTQVPGGVLARKYGTKLVFGLANVIGCWLCFFMPIASYFDYKALIFLRVLQGLICGVCWPAMHHMTGQWIPPNERSKFVTAYLGSSVGIALNFPLFGYIISWTSWEYVFHFCGIFGTIWYIGWVFFVFDTPAQHPRIHPEERDYIEKSLGITEKTKEKAPTPWLEILKSRAVWMTVVAQWGGIWGLFTLMTQAPTYFKYIHGWDIKMTGILSGLPHMMRMLFAFVFSTFGDYLLRKNKMSRTNVRKMGGTMCCIVKGCFVLALAYSGCNSTAAIVFLTLATAVHGAVSTGPLASIVDLSPNYAGILLGISGMIGVIPGFISPIIVGILTLGNQTVQQWEYVFLISAGMLIVSGILYIIFSDSTLQTWNTPQETYGREMEALKSVINSKEQEVNEQIKMQNEEDNGEEEEEGNEDEQVNTVLVN